MKVILSRKGFDSVNGGIPSAIMPNGDVVSFPIPSDDPAMYSDLRYDSHSYQSLLDDLAREYGHETCPLEHCHVDPDLDGTRWKQKPSGWKPAFGQISASSRYLTDTVGVEENDLFLFFGSFHFLQKDLMDRFEFSSGTGDFYHDADLHLIFGYLQVGEIIRDPSRIRQEYPWHPHADMRAEDESNILIVPRRTLSFAPERPGSGFLPFSKDRVLTRVGKSRAYWRYNPAYAPENIIVSKGRKNSSRDSACIYYSGIWQELGLKDLPSTEAWGKQMVLAS